MSDSDDAYGTIIPPWHGTELTWKPRHRAAFHEDDGLFPIPPVPAADPCLSLRWRDQND